MQNEISYEGNFTSITIEDMKRTLDHLKNYSNLQTNQLEKLFSKYGKIVPVDTPGNAIDPLNEFTPSIANISVTTREKDFVAQLNNFKFPTFVYNYKVMIPLLKAYNNRQREIKMDLKNLRSRRKDLEKHISDITSENQHMENFLNDEMKKPFKRSFSNRSQLYRSNDNITINDGKKKFGEDRESREIKEMEEEIRLFEEENKLFAEEINEMRKLIKGVEEEQKSIMENSQLLPTHNPHKVKEVLLNVKKKILFVENEKNELQERVEIETRKLKERQRIIERLKADLKRKEDLKNKEMQKKNMEKEELKKNITLQKKDLKKLKEERETLVEDVEKIEGECVEFQNNELDALQKLKSLTEQLSELKYEIKLKSESNKSKQQRIEDIEEEIHNESKRYSEKSKLIVEKIRPKYEDKMKAIRLKIDKLNEEIIEETEKLRVAKESKKKAQDEFDDRLKRIEEQQKKPPKLIASLSNEISLLFTEKDEFDLKSKTLREEFRSKQVENERKMQEMNVKVQSTKKKILEVEKNIGEDSITYESIVSKIHEINEKSKLLQIEMERDENTHKEELQKVVFEKKKKMQEVIRKVKQSRESLEQLINERREIEEKIEQSKKEFDNGINRKIETLQLQINESSDENDMLKLRNSELKDRHALLIREKKSLAMDFEDFEDYKNKLQKQLVMANERARTSGVKIKELLAKEEELLSKKKELVINIQTKKIQFDREKRKNITQSLEI